MALINAILPPDVWRNIVSIACRRTHNPYRDPDWKHTTCSRVANRIALVCGACHRLVVSQTAQLTRVVTIKPPIADEPKPWWRFVIASRDITDAGLATLATVCTAITVMDLNGCEIISDAALASLAARCAAISKLSPCECHAITDAGLKTLAAGCSAITDLNLYGCGWITDVGLASLARGCHTIERLNLGRCHHVSDVGLASLAQGCPCISILNLTWLQWTEPPQLGVAQSDQRCGTGQAS